MNKLQFLLACELLILALVNLFEPAQLSRVSNLLTACQLSVNDTTTVTLLEDKWHDVALEKYIDQIDAILEQTLPLKFKMNSTSKGFFDDDDEGKPIADELNTVNNDVMGEDSTDLVGVPLVNTGKKDFEELIDQICGKDEVCGIIKTCSKR